MDRKEDYSSSSVPGQTLSPTSETVTRADQAARQCRHHLPPPKIDPTIHENGCPTGAGIRRERDHRLPYTPRTNGMAERFNAAMAGIIKTTGFACSVEVEKNLLTCADTYVQLAPRKRLGTRGRLSHGQAGSRPFTNGTKKGAGMLSLPAAYPSEPRHVGRESPPVGVFGVMSWWNCPVKVKGPGRCGGAKNDGRIASARSASKFSCASHGFSRNTRGYSDRP